MKEKEEYKSFCKAHASLPLFHMPEWWDTVSEEWHVKKFDQGNAFAFLPYKIEKKFGFQLVRNPHLTPYSGLLFGNENYSVSIKKDFIQQALTFLQSFSLGDIDCNPTFCGGIELPKTKTTFLLSLKNGFATIEENYKSSLKRQLKKAAKSLVINECTDTKLFFEVYLDSINKYKNANRTPQEIIDRAFQFCRKHKNGHIFTAVDMDNNVHAAIFYVEDNETAYYLLGGSRTEFLGSGAMGFLLSECIRLAHRNGKKTFDFEGSEVPGVARFFSTFGGELVHYPVLSIKTNPRLKILMKIKGMF